MTPHLWNHGQFHFYLQTKHTLFSKRYGMYKRKTTKFGPNKAKYLFLEKKYPKIKRENFKGLKRWKEKRQRKLR